MHLLPTTQLTKRILVIVFSCLALMACFKSKKMVPKAAFTTVKDCKGITPCEVRFINQSEGALSSRWDFGDGTTSTLKNPVHTYQNGAFFEVKLWAKGEDDETLFIDTVFIFETAPCESKGSFACAKKMSSGSPVRDVIIPDQPINYYFFRPAKPGVAFIELKPAPAGGYVRIDVLSEANAGSTVITSATGNPGETIKFFSGPLQNREYYIRVYQNGATPASEPYTLSYTAVNSDENEVNNTFAQATPIFPGVTIQGTILAQKDVDYFVWDQQKPGIVDILLTPVPLFPDNSRLYLTIYSEANSSAELKNVYRFPGESIQVSAGPLNAGKHYIRLAGYPSVESTDPYKLTIRQDMSDTNEINNSFSTATDIQVGVPMRGTIRSAGDADFFKFTATKNGPVTINIPNIPNGLTYMYVEAYSAANSSSSFITKGAYPNNPITAISSQSLVANNVYYIKLQASAGESNEQYILNLTQ